MVIKKRCLLWDLTNTAHRSEAMERITFAGPLYSCSNWNAWVPLELTNQLPFRPTVRSTYQRTDPNERGMTSNNDYAIFHYFNEPERAGISPNSAAEMWKEKMVPSRKEKARKLLDLVGPLIKLERLGLMIL